jgi:hypothetical protein
LHNVRFSGLPKKPSVLGSELSRNEAKVTLFTASPRKLILA